MHCDFLENIITRDETSICECGPETKPQSNEWYNRNRHLKTRFSDADYFRWQEVCCPFGNRARRTNSQWFLLRGSVIRRLNRRVKRVQPEIADNWKLHHDNASSYTSFVVTDQFSSLPRVLILSLRFFLSLKVKTNPKECHCKTLEAVKRFGLKL